MPFVHHNINREWEIVTMKELCRRLSLDDSLEAGEMPLPQGSTDSQILDEFMINQIVDILPPRAEGKHFWVESHKFYISRLPVDSNLQCRETRFFFDDNVQVSTHFSNVYFYFTVLEKCPSGKTKWVRCCCWSVTLKATCLVRYQAQLCCPKKVTTEPETLHCCSDSLASIRTQGKL